MSWTQTMRPAQHNNPTRVPTNRTSMPKRSHSMWTPNSINGYWSGDRHERSWKVAFQKNGQSICTSQGIGTPWIVCAAKAVDSIHTVYVTLYVERCNPIHFIWVTIMKRLFYLDTTTTNRLHRVRMVNRCRINRSNRVNRYSNINSTHHPGTSQRIIGRFCRISS